MIIAEKHSHLNGKEYLMVHNNQVLQEIKNAINSINAYSFKTKISKEKGMKGKKLFNPVEINGEFKNIFNANGWQESRYQYYVDTDYKTVEKIKDLPLADQKKHLKKKGVGNPIRSYKQTDFVKDKVAVEVQFGKYAFVAYDLFIKHLLFYTGGAINVGVEILPMKCMQAEMSSGISYYEGEVYNLHRHGRNSPAVPLVIFGIAPDPKNKPSHSASQD
jgi:hypothetical protein